MWLNKICKWSKLNPVVIAIFLKTELQKMWPLSADNSIIIICSNFAQNSKYDNWIPEFKDIATRISCNPAYLLKTPSPQNLNIAHRIQYVMKLTTTNTK